MRRRKGLSQRALALRAGTSQSAIARIERGEEEVTWPRLRTILLAMGEEPVLASAPLRGRYQPDHLLQDRGMSPEARLAGGIRFSRFATELAMAGEKAGRDRGS